jgi:hypothetical protein
MTDEQIEELKRLEAATTPGPWEITDGTPCNYPEWATQQDSNCEATIWAHGAQYTNEKEGYSIHVAIGVAQWLYTRRDAEFFVAAKNNIPLLLAEYAALKSALRELVDLKDNVKETDPDDYERRKPLAWEAARNALKEKP